MRRLDLNPAQRRPPLRSLAEMAAELGISTHKLSAELHADPAAPRKRLQHHGAVCGTWYEPRELRAWWAQRQR